MADTFTTNYNLTKPQVGASRDTWGAKMNADLDAIDTAIKAAKDQAAAALPKVGGTITGEITFTGQGVVPHWNGSGKTAGEMFLSPAAGASPLTLPGQIWFGHA